MGFPIFLTCFMCISHVAIVYSKNNSILRMLNQDCVGLWKFITIFTLNIFKHDAFATNQKDACAFIGITCKRSMHTPCRGDILGMSQCKLHPNVYPTIPRMAWESGTNLVIPYEWKDMSNMRVTIFPPKTLFF